MERQMKYTSVYPSGPFETTRQAAWAFLCLNQATAPEALVQWFQSECKRLEHISMARQAKKTGGVGNNDKAEWTGFANIDLSAEDKHAIKGGVLDGDSILAIIADMLATGHKLALSYDPQKDTVTGSVTGVYKNCKNAGLTLTSFARSITDVLAVIAYKHEVVAKGDWTKFISRRSDPDELG